MESSQPEYQCTRAHFRGDGKCLDCGMDLSNTFSPLGFKSNLDIYIGTIKNELDSQREMHSAQHGGLYEEGLIAGLQFALNGLASEGDKWIFQLK